MHKKLAHIGKLSEHLAGSGKAWDTMALTDIDIFLIGCGERYARSTVADIAGRVRCFARFLLATGRISIDLAEAVITPVQPKLERPAVRCRGRTCSACCGRWTCRHPATFGTMRSCK